MCHQTVIWIVLALTLVLQSVTAFASEAANGAGTGAGGGAECMPGWNAIEAKARAVQRAYACSKADSFEDCKAQMGVGQVAQFAVASAMGRGLMRGAGQSVRDLSYHVCDGAASLRSPLSPWINEAWAKGPCLANELVVRGKLQYIGSLLNEESTRVLENQKAILAEKEKALAHLEGAEDRGKEMLRQAEQAQKDLKEAVQVASQKHVALTNELGLKEALEARDGAHLLSASNWRTLKGDLRQYAQPLMKFADPTEGASPEELKKALLEHRVSEVHAQQIAEQLQRAIAADEKFMHAANRVHLVRNFPGLVAAQEALERAEKAQQAFKAPVIPPKPDSKILDSMKAELSTIRNDLKVLEDRHAAIKLLQGASLGQMDPSEIEDAINAIKKIVPEANVAYPNQGAVAQALANLEAMPKTVLQKWEKAGTNSSIPALMRNIAIAGSKFKTIGTKVAIGAVVAVKASLASATEMALHGTPGGYETCEQSGSKETELFERVAKNECRFDFSFERPATRQLLARDSKSLCLLAKEHPSVVEMINYNFSVYYPPAQAQCTNPMTFSLPGGTKVEFSPEKLVYSKNAQEPLTLTYQSGVERDVSFNRPVVRTDGRKDMERHKIKFGPGGDTYPKAYTDFARVYKTTLLPMMAEAQACCPGAKGMVPDEKSCAQWGIKPAKQNESPAPRKSGPVSI